MTKQERVILAADERCDRSHIERARWIATSPDSGKVITLCNYHFRRHQIKLAMAGWAVTPINREDSA